MKITIWRPAAGEAAAVDNTGTGPAFICSRGEVDADRKKLTQLDVCAYIYRPADTIPNDPPNGAWCAAVGSDNLWEIPRIFFPSTIPTPCAAPPGAYPPFKLAVWARSGSTTVAGPNDQPFCGRCASAVDCGSGSGAYFCTGSGYPVVGSGGGAGVAMALAIAPLQWALGVAGFLGDALSVFNGQWLLSLRDSAGGCVWDNGGEAANVPVVALRCDDPLLSVWRLTFRQNGEAIEYTRPAGDWNVLGANTFTTLATNGHAPALAQRVPASVTVLPV